MKRMNDAQQVIRQHWKQLLFAYNYGYPRTDTMKAYAWLVTWWAIGQLYALEDRA